ncbi:uncharacterized protein LOC121399478 [Xenopus laevis]|uniref:Uncharacterized protein LOC121399478 n=1 Tax=Xenopus laevis TaxID=8355 RepID=A0A8J1M3C3_XENLA|nr:uncharacterized protein LOC121399478 [Xenopus laevis]
MDLGGFKGAPYIFCSFFVDFTFAVKFTKSLFYVTGETVMGCIRSKSCEFENSLQSTLIRDPVEIHEITDICDSLVEFIATIEMPDHSAQPSLLESPHPAESEEDPDDSHKTEGAIPLHEPESSEEAEDDNRDSASPTTFIWLSFDATVEIPVVMDISEALVNICVAANVYEPPQMSTLLNAEAPESDAGMSSNIGHTQEQTDAEPEEDTEDEANSISFSLPLDLQNPDTGSDIYDGQGAGGASYRYLI